MRIGFYLILLILNIQISLKANTHKALSIPHACALGLTQGITEFLPVSSTGHMILVNTLFEPTVKKEALGTAQNELNTYMVSIQLGTIAVLLLYYRREIHKILLGLCGKHPEGLRLACNLIVAFIPVGFMGFLGGDWIQTHLYNATCVTAAICVGGLCIFGIENYRKRTQVRWTLSCMPVHLALFIGLWQLMALWPGFSRSLATILGGIVVGLSLVESVQFSFLLGLLTSTVATGYKCLKQGPSMMQQLDIIPMLLGIVIAFLVGLATIHIFFKYLKEHGLKLLGYYRLILAIIFTIFAK